MLAGQQYLHIKIILQLFRKIKEEKELAWRRQWFIIIVTTDGIKINGGDIRMSNFITALMKQRRDAKKAQPDTHGRLKEIIAVLKKYNYDDGIYTRDCRQHSD